VQWRERTCLSLNIDFYNKAFQRGEDRDRQRAIKMILALPEEGELRMRFPEAYPLWLMEEKFLEKATAFQAIARLAWTLIRLAHSYPQPFVLFRSASMREALRYLLGEAPLKPSERKQYLGGEKAYTRHFKTYRSVCHFVTAAEKLREEGENPWDLQEAASIERFLGMAAFAGNNLLSISAPHQFAVELFPPNPFLPLPSWVKEVEREIQPIASKLERETAKSLGSEQKREGV
jgi:hypothetical protein